MLIVLAIVLIAIGLVSLAIGVFSATVGWVFASIGVTAAAGVVLFVVHRLGRRPPAGDPRGAPLMAAAAPPAVGIPAAAPPVVAMADLSPAVVAGPDAPPPNVVALAAAALADALADAPGPEGPDGPDDPATRDERAFAPVPLGDGPDFPVADYDALRVAEILPLLPGLDPAELALVRAHEVGTKSRATILARLDDLLAASPEATDAGALEEPPDR